MSKELIGSHSVHETLVRQTQIDAARIEELERELECERLRLAACGVVALANTPESAAKAREMLPKYRSASCNDVARIVDSEMALRQERDALQADNARLLEALENCRLLAARHRKEEWAGHVLRLCESAGVAATVLRSPK